jgi:ligand-binding SRPBCC domain-containing protein
MGHLQTSRLIPAPPSAVFAYITDLKTLPEQLEPDFKIDSDVETPVLRDRSEFGVSVTRFGVSTKIVLCVTELKPAERFTYRQISGFFRSWTHTQTLQSHDPKTTLLTDIVDYHMRLGIFGALADDLIVRRDLQNVLEDRLARIEQHFA